MMDEIKGSYTGRDCLYCGRNRVDAKTNTCEKCNVEQLSLCFNGEHGITPMDLGDRIAAARAADTERIVRVEGQAEMATRGLESAAATIAASAQRIERLEGALKDRRAWLYSYIVSNKGDIQTADIYCAVTFIDAALAPPSQQGTEREATDGERLDWLFKQKL